MKFFSIDFRFFTIRALSSVLQKFGRNIYSLIYSIIRSISTSSLYYFSQNNESLHIDKNMEKRVILFYFDIKGSCIFHKFRKSFLVNLYKNIQ